MVLKLKRSKQIMKTYYQAVIQYHSSLMDDYRVLTYEDFDTLKDAQNFIEEWYKKHVYSIKDDDPDNPISDLYDSFIQELEQGTGKRINFY